MGEPFLTDDIRSWRHFRSRIRNGEVEDHLQRGMSRSVTTDNVDSTRVFNKFYFNSDSGRPGKGVEQISAMSKSLPTKSRTLQQRGNRSPPKPAGIEVDLPTLSLNLPAVKEASSEKQSSSAGRATEDDIFDLEM